MRQTKTFVALLVATLVSGCLKPPAIVTTDYCARASRVELLDLCAPGVAPAITGRGWGSCSITTRRDAEALAAEARKFDRCKDE
jgi:hypothetical protein